MSNSIDLSSPPPIGMTVPNRAHFTYVTTDGITGSVIANKHDVTNGYSTNTVITPYTLHNLLQEPPVIGRRTPNDAYFSSIKGPVIATMSD